MKKLLLVIAGSMALLGVTVTLAGSGPIVKIVNNVTDALTNPADKDAVLKSGGIFDITVKSQEVTWYNPRIFTGHTMTVDFSNLYNVSFEHTVVLINAIKNAYFFSYGGSDYSCSDNLAYSLNKFAYAKNVTITVSAEPFNTPGLPGTYRLHCNISGN